MGETSHHVLLLDPKDIGLDVLNAVQLTALGNVLRRSKGLGGRRCGTPALSARENLHARFHVC